MGLDQNCAIVIILAQPYQKNIEIETVYKGKCSGRFSLFFFLPLEGKERG